MVDESSGVGEMCRGDAITGDKLDGVERMRGVGVSWINRGEDGAEGVRGVVGFMGDTDWLIRLIIIFSMSS